MVSAHDLDRESALGELARFRQEFYECLPTRADAAFEVSEAMLCTEGPVRTLLDLSMAPEHRGGHGTLYDALNCGRIDVARLRRSLAGLELPRSADGRLVLGVDVSSWLRPEAATCPDRSFCHTYGRASGSTQMIPGWPYSVIAALETGPTSWTTVLDAVRLEPDADGAAATVAQVRATVERLIAAGQWSPADPEVLIVFDAGYDVPRIASLLADLPGGDPEADAVGPGAASPAATACARDQRTATHAWQRVRLRQPRKLEQ